MKTLATYLIAILLLAAASPLTVRADLPPDWSTNYNAALASSATNQAPVLFFFTASWCGPCKLMTRTTLADPAITRALAEVDHVALDIDEHGDLATHYGISAVPTFVLTSDDGEVDRTTGYQPVEELRTGWPKGWPRRILNRNNSPRINSRWRKWTNCWRPAMPVRRGRRRPSCSPSAPGATTPWCRRQPGD